MQLSYLGKLVLAATFTFSMTPVLAVAQTAGQDMHRAGTETKDAAKDTGHGVKTGTKKAYHATSHTTKKAYHKTASGTEKGYDKTKSGTETGYHKTVNGTKDLGDKIAGKPEPRR